MSKIFKTPLMLAAAVSILLIGAGCSLTTTVKTPVKNTNTIVAPAPITYAGQDGKNALELLQAHHLVDVSKEGFVNAIDGKKPGDHEFWALYVNGTSAAVGAKDLITKSSDAVSWKLERY